MSFNESLSSRETVADRILAHCSEPASIHGTAEVPTLVEIIANAMAAVGYAKPDIFGMRLALEEALVNAVKHGNRGDPQKRVLVRYHVTAEQVLVQIEDQGAGFDPTRVPDPTDAEHLDCPCGRGLLLIRHYTTWVQYNARGNRVTLCKKR